MSLLDHPEAQALLADAVVMPESVRGRDDRLTAFLQRYLPRRFTIGALMLAVAGAAALSAVWAERRRVGRYALGTVIVVFLGAAAFLAWQFLGG